MKQFIIVITISKMIVKTFGFILFLSLSQSKTNFMPNLPMGEYHVAINKIYPCSCTKNHSIQLNLYLSKKTSNITELKGNITLLMPYGDTLTLDMNFASWGLTGGWIPNSNMIITKKACSNIKKLGGNAWFSLLKGFNIPTDNCPIPVGTYITPGIELKKLEDINGPRVYFYGKYKIVFRFKNVKTEVVSCVVVEVNILRPWETTI